MLLALTAGPFPPAARGAAPAAQPVEKATGTAGSGTGAYTVGGIAVDVAAKTAAEARNAAFREAQRRAWPQLWARMTGLAAGSAPRLGDGGLDEIVAGIEVQGEHFSTTRYIATLGVVFDRARASEFFAGTGGALHSEPMLLLPVMVDGGVRYVYEVKTPWVAAWSRFNEGTSPLDYVLASGSAGDNVLLTAYQAQRSDRPLWRNILGRFKTVDVLTAEVRLIRDYPGGPITAQFTARHGPDATELGRFALQTGAASGLDAMLDQGVQQIDALYTQALRDGRLRSDPTLSAEALAPIASAAPLLDLPGATVSEGGTAALVATPDAAAWLLLEHDIKATSGVTGVTLTSLSLGGSSRIIVRHGDSIEMLAYNFDQAGLRLVAAEGGWLIRRKQEGDAPVPKPLPPVVETLGGGETVPAEAAPPAAETPVPPQ